MPRLSFHASPALARELRKRAEGGGQGALSRVIRAAIDRGLDTPEDEIASSELRMQGQRLNKLLVGRLGSALREELERALADLGEEPGA